LTAASGEVDINSFREDLGKGMNVEVKLGKVKASVIRMAIALDTNLHELQMLVRVVEFCSIRFRALK
jgi:predicted RecB family endonuclease